MRFSWEMSFYLWFRIWFDFLFEVYQFNEFKKFTKKSMLPPFKIFHNFNNLIFCVKLEELLKFSIKINLKRFSDQNYGK